MQFPKIILAYIAALKSKCNEDVFHSLLVLICLFLPFQFALNPKQGFDLAIIRVAIPLLFICWTIVRLKHKEKILADIKLPFLLLIFLILATLSLFLSHNLFWSLRKLFFLFSIIPIYFVASSVLNTEKKKRAIAIALVLGALALATISLIQFAAQFVFGIEPVYAFLADHIAPFFLGNSFSKSVLAYPSWLVNVDGVTYLRAIGVFPDPHMLSYYLGMLIPWSIALWATSKKYSKLFFISTALLIIVNAYTYTRGGYIALIFGALIVLPLVSKSNMKKILFGITALIFLFILTPSGPVADRFTSSFDTQEGSNQGRIANWRQAVPVILNNPFGVGIGMYSLAIDPEANYRKPIYAHNLYLDIAAELGLFASLVFMAILFFSAASFWKASENQPFFIAGVSSITIFSVQSLVETPLYSVHVLTLLMLILALSSQADSHGKNIIK